MGLFSSETIEGINESLGDGVDEMIEAIIVDEASRMSEEELKAWCESDEAKALVEAQALRKPTLMRLSKADDAKRRKKIAAYQIAKRNNDPLYTKLIKYRTLWKQTSDKIVQKYGTKAERISKKGQAEYIRNYSKNVKAGKVKAPSVVK